MRTVLLMLSVLILCACSRGAGNGANVSVANLKVGLMRENSNGEWSVYQPGYSFPLVPNGPCVVAEKTQTCMWYGFEFDYISSADDQILMCQARFNKPTDMVSAERIEKKDSAEASFAIPLRGREGHYSQSAYVFRNPDDAPTPWSAEISCKHNDTEVVRFTFTALYGA